MRKDEKEFYCADNSVGKISGNHFYGDTGNITAGIGNTVYSAASNSSKCRENNISDEEWKKLAVFLMDRQFSAEDIDKKYHVQYAKAEEMAKKKDKEGLRALFKTAGASFLDVILGAGIQTGVKEIVKKITGLV